ncbi:demethoxyubiquinone hydroxylase family protein [Thalassobaculum sp.]|uniref:demethoxyubiquinone hydroxylase family protein n=1 Tax=Thalassobaculum sp. TaxID=2022740 RepID=UPI003B5B68BB
MTETAAKQRTTARRLPGDLSKRAQIDRILRVDHAGEFGAQRIYQGQLAVLGRRPCGKTIRHMQQQEERHLAAFEKLMVERRARPTLLHPFWNIAGYALGAGTALMGEKAAMACTIAVEEVIDDHYRRQYESLGEDEAELKQTIETFRAEEAEHADIGRAHGGEDTVGYPVMRAAIAAGSRLAIWLSERV